MVFLPPFFLWFSSISSMDLALLIGRNLFALHTEHSSLQIKKERGYLRTIFFVVLTFFLKIGLVCPP